jgi:hypothetical protein
MRKIGTYRHVVVDEGEAVVVVVEVRVAEARVVAGMVVVASVVADVVVGVELQPHQIPVHLFVEVDVFAGNGNKWLHH